MMHLRMEQIKHGMVKNPFGQELITSWLNVQTTIEFNS